MKCDKLKRKYSDITGPYYGYNEATEAIEELLAENERLKRELDKSNEIMQFVEKLRATRRALWIARADRAKERKIHFDTLDYFGISFVTINFESARTWMKCRIEEPSKWAVIFEKVEQKCMAKAEEFGG